MLFLKNLAFVWICLSTALAHTWIEQIQAIKDGKYFGAFGYPRGYVPRATDPTVVDIDSLMVWKLPEDEGSLGLRIDNTMHICKETQRQQNQTDGYPRLRINPGGWMAMKYLENGHVSNPGVPPGKPPHGGSVYVFGTSQPKADEKILDVFHWTQDGKGGDQRGRLLAVQNYDDGRCHQINAGTISTERQQKYPDRFPENPDSNTEQWCETDVQVPTSISPNQVYTLYWVWQWTTLPGVDSSVPDGKDEYYTTCSDLEIVGSEAAVADDTSPVALKPLNQQDPQVSAVSDYMSRPALTDDPLSQYANMSGFGVTSTPPSTNSTSPSITTGHTITTTSVPVYGMPSGNSAELASTRSETVTVTEWITITTPYAANQAATSTVMVPTSTQTTATYARRHSNKRHMHGAKFRY